MMNEKKTMLVSEVCKTKIRIPCSTCGSLMWNVQFDRLVRQSKLTNDLINLLNASMYVRMSQCMNNNV